jgi:hypothetical protein
LAWPKDLVPKSSFSATQRVRCFLRGWLSPTPVKVAGLILFSPAFGVHSFAQAGAWTGYLTRSLTADGKVSTGHSGLGLESAGQPERSCLAKSELKRWRSYTYASKRLKDVPVWMASTTADIVIQKQEARGFMAALKGKSSSAVSRKEL